jgi:hypothetical protein
MSVSSYKDVWPAATTLTHAPNVSERHTALSDLGTIVWETVSNEVACYVRSRPETRLGATYSSK